MIFIRDMQNLKLGDIFDYNGTRLKTIALCKHGKQLIDMSKDHSHAVEVREGYLACREVN